MSGTDLTSGADRDPVEVLAEEFVERQRRGERPSLSEYTGKYPDLAERIRDVFSALLLIEQISPPSEGPQSREGAAPARARDHIISTMSRLGDFRILREVGRGGMGVVYEAVQESLGRHVALKILSLTGRLSSTQVERFQLEARSAARLHHGNIVPVHGVGEHEGVHYYAMQFIAGHGLDRILDDLRRLRVMGLRSTGPRWGDRQLCPTADRSGSMELTRSLVTGVFEQVSQAAGGASVCASPPTVPRMVDETITDYRLTADEPTCTSQPHSFEPARPPADSARRASPDPTPPETSSRSLTAKGQFYRSMARIGLQVADALAYAHQQGVLHRDIKPSNLLLDAAGTIWVTDFGLAKLEGSDGPTRTGEIVGTVRYMAPERFDGWSDRRSDVYSLGATLYELLTLNPLFPRASHGELIQKVLHDAPDLPRKLDPNVPRDLETIVLKAIAKEPGSRYPTAQALGEDLRRFLEDRPIRARRSTALEQLWRWCRRNPLLAAAFSTAAAAVVTLAIVSTAMAWKFREQRDHVRQSEGQEHLARIAERHQLFQALFDRARAQRYSRQRGQRFDSLSALDRAVAIAHDLKLPTERFDQLRDEAIACLALPDLRPEPGSRIIARPAGVARVAFDPTLTRYALRFKDGTISVRRVADDEEVAHFQVRGDRDFFVLCFSPNGRYLATNHYPDHGVTVWDVGRRSVLIADPGPLSAAAAQFSPDSRRFAIAREDGELLIYELATGQPRRRWRIPGVKNLAFSPDGAELAAIENASTPPTCRIVATATGRLVRSIVLQTIGSVAWSPDGLTLATPDNDRKIYLWDAATGQPRETLEGHSNAGILAGFHPLSTLLASNGWEARLRLWDPILGRSWLSEPGASVIDGHFSHDGRVVLSLGERLTTFQVEPALEYRALRSSSTGPFPLERPAIRHDGRVLAVGARNGVVLWDLARSAELGFLPIGYTPHLRFDASGDLLTSGRAGVWQWPVRLDPHRGEFRLGPSRPLPLQSAGCELAADRLGWVVASAVMDSASVCTADRVIQLRSLQDVRSVAVSPDGQWVATGSHGRNGAQVFSVRDAKRVADLAIEGLVRVEFSPDGQWLMTTSPPCRLWKVGTWREPLEIGGQGLCFSPAGRLLAAKDEDQVLRLVETETGRTVARLTSPDLGDVSGAAFSPDGSRLAVNNSSRPVVQVWNLRSIRNHLHGIGLDWDRPAYSGDDPAGSEAPPLPPLQVDFGSLADELELFNEPFEAVLKRCTARLKRDPSDAHAHELRARALVHLRRFPEAIEAVTNAIRLRPGDADVRALRGQLRGHLGQHELAIDDLEAARRLAPDDRLRSVRVAEVCTARAWVLATGPAPGRDLERALALARRAVDLSPWDADCASALGVALYRAGQYAESITMLERSLGACRGEPSPCDLYFLAMAHHRLRHAALARARYHDAVRWMQNHPAPSERRAGELAAFRAEAERVLAGSADDLPDEVFAPR
jgi:eukaryotic-like serine/threonine-protein kinase